MNNKNYFSAQGRVGVVNLTSGRSEEEKQSKMGNGSSSPYLPLQEEGKSGDSRIVLFGSESPKYGATANSPSAFKRQDQGRPRGRLFTFQSDAMSSQ